MLVFQICAHLSLFWHDLIRLGKNATISCNFARQRLEETSQEILSSSRFVNKENTQAFLYYKDVIKSYLLRKCPKSNVAFNRRLSLDIDNRIQAYINYMNEDI